MGRLALIAILLVLPAVASAGYPECEYNNSKVVQSRLTGLKGMVVSHHRTDQDELVPRNCRYDIRFVTDSGWVYTIEKMRPYEIKWPPKEPTVTISPVPPRPTGVEGLDFGG